MGINIPMLLMMVLTMVVWVVMGRRRVAWVRAEKGAIGKLRTRAQAGDTPTKVRQAADNFQNQFELPVLFYVLTFYIAWENEISWLDLWLAYFFVASRYVHSYIHCSYNNVIHRFWAYTAGALALWLMLLMTIWGTIF